MLKEYFAAVQNQLMGTAAVKEGKKSAKKTTVKEQPDAKAMIQFLTSIMPAEFELSDRKPVDVNGYVPKTVDYIAYYKKWNVVDQMMNGHIPSELVYATYHIVEALDMRRLSETLNSVTLVKKLNKFSETEENVIPAFIIAQSSELSLPILKNAVLDYYIERSVEHVLEFDIMMILGQGVVIKDWREKRKFVALETEEDTLLWFFILMNEYLDVDKKRLCDMRSYVKETKRYREF